MHSLSALVSEEVLLRRLTWSKLLDPGKKGQWCLSGDSAVKLNNAEDVALTMDAQRMKNTDSRKAILCVIMMSCEDYIYAFGQRDHEGSTLLSAGESF